MGWNGKPYLEKNLFVTASSHGALPRPMRFHSGHTWSRPSAEEFGELDDLGPFRTISGYFCLVMTSTFPLIVGIGWLNHQPDFLAFLVRPPVPKSPRLQTLPELANAFSSFHRAANSWQFSNWTEGGRIENDRKWIENG